MVSRESIDGFVGGRTLAIVGVSADGKGFGNAAYKELKAKGYTVFPVNPKASRIQGDPCWPSLSALPQPVERVLVVVKPDRVEEVVREAAAAGAKRVWLQQGSESAAAVDACRQAGLDVVDGQCILMFAEPVTSVHKFHRWIWRLIGKAPRPA